MRQRDGFVSNSSSSSFIIGVKGKLTEEKIMRSFQVGEKSPLFKLAKGMAKIMLDSEKYTLKEFLDDRAVDFEDLSEIEKKIFDQGYTFYQGYASDECSDDLGAEPALCCLEITYEDEEIIISKESRY